MYRYVIRRLLQAIPVLLVISLISFVIIIAAPGDPTRTLADPNAPPEELVRVRQALGLDKPPHIMYGLWLKRILSGDMGRSYISYEPVTAILARTLPFTLKVQGLAFIFSFVVAIVLGVVSATQRYTLLDYLTTLIAFVGVALPNFWLGLMLMLVFSVHLRWLPSIGLWPAGISDPTWLDMLPHLVLPTIVLGTEPLAVLSRYVRSSLLEVLSLDYVRTARAKGLPERVVLYRHALRNALMPVITMLGLSLPGLVAGSVVVESLFGIPGMGRTLVTAVFQRDYNVIMGVYLTLAALTVVGNLLADLLYAVVDPRVTYS